MGQPVRACRLAIRLAGMPAPAVLATPLVTVPTPFSAGSHEINPAGENHQGHEQVFSVRSCPGASMDHLPMSFTKS
jgi:hypothetical protein